MMPGHLQKHPYLKSYDELQRTAGRMRTYRELNMDLLSKEERHALDRLIEHVEIALDEVPEKYRLTKHFQYKEK